MTKDIRPASMTSNGAIATLPPAGSTLAVASSTESTARYVFHMGGAPVAASSGDCGEMAATWWPRSTAIEYTCPWSIGWSS